MKDHNSTFLKIVLAYCLIIGTVLLWSGHDREKTVFDKYLISLKGLTLNCKNIELSKLFFKEVLEFQEVEKQDKLFILPDNSSLGLLDDKTSDKSNVEIRLRVRNGIYKLHERLVGRISQFNLSHGAGNISDYEKSDTAILFSIVDPSDIKITFYQDKVFSESL